MVDIDISPEKALAAFELFKKAKGYFEPFKPETTHVSISYREQLCEMRLHIHVPEGIRRHTGKVEIVKSPQFQIREILDLRTCSRVTQPGFYIEDGKWKLDASKLPASEDYLVFLEGRIDSAVLSKIVRVQPSRNRDQTQDVDRYWLDSMISDVTILEKVWKQLEVQDINIGVRVSIDNAFSSALPFDLKEKAEATQRLLESAKSKGRDEVFNDLMVYRHTAKKSTLSIDKVVMMAQRLSSPDRFTDFVSVDPPYRLGGILHDDGVRRKPFPEIVNVNARTDLDFKSPIATGYLTFDKKTYIQNVKKMLESVL